MKIFKFSIFLKNFLFWCLMFVTWELWINCQTQIELRIFEFSTRLKFFEHFYRIGEDETQSGRQLIMQLTPCILTKKVWRREKDLTRHRKRTKYSHSAPGDFYLVHLSRIWARGMKARKISHKTPKQNQIFPHISFFFGRFLSNLRTSYLVYILGYEYLGLHSYSRIWHHKIA